MSVIAAIFKDWFAVPAGASRVLEALYMRRGFVAIERIARDAAIKPACVKVFISALREAMDCEAIDTSYGRPGLQGYALTRIGRDDCERALEDARQRMGTHQALTPTTADEQAA